MTNLELIGILVGIFGDYAAYLLPVFGFLAGLNLLVSWIEWAMFKVPVAPFKR